MINQHSNMQHINKIFWELLRIKTKRISLNKWASSCKDRQIKCSIKFLTWCLRIYLSYNPSSILLLIWCWVGASEWGITIHQLILSISLMHHSRNYVFFGHRHSGKVRKRRRFINRSIFSFTTRHTQVIITATNYSRVSWQREIIWSSKRIIYVISRRRRAWWWQTGFFLQILNGSLSSSSRDNRTLHPTCFINVSLKHCNSICHFFEFNIRLYWFWPVKRKKLWMI